MQKQEAGRQFEQLIGEHDLLLHKVCRIYAYTDADREDLFQEIVIQLWKAYPKFKGDSQVSTWMYRVAINTAITGLRKKRDIITSYEPGNIPEQVSDDQCSIAAEEQLQQMYTAIEQLNEIESHCDAIYGRASL